MSAKPSSEADGGDQRRRRARARSPSARAAASGSPAATSKLTWTSPSSIAWSVAIFVSDGAQPLDRRRAGPGAAWATGGCARARRSRRARSTAVAVALEPLLGRVALRGQALGLARLLEHRAALGERRLGLGAALAGDRQRVAVPLEAPERVLARLEAARRRRSTASSATLRRPGFLTPRVWRSWRARSSLLPGAARAAVGAADRRLEAVAEGALVALEAGQLVVADRRRGPEEALGRHAGDAPPAPRRRAPGR